ncbi:hypothetical protein J7L05_08575 [bacterium]|nr:hypothetical protein [bacterium]
MAEAEYTYRCLRCGYEYKAMYDPATGPKELTCPGMPQQFGSTPAA